MKCFCWLPCALGEPKALNAEYFRGNEILCFQSIFYQTKDLCLRKIIQGLPCLLVLFLSVKSIFQWLICRKNLSPPFLPPLLNLVQTQPCILILGLCSRIKIFWCQFQPMYFHRSWIKCKSFPFNSAASLTNISHEDR